jgi:hypothetical protein
LVLNGANVGKWADEAAVRRLHLDLDDELSAVEGRPVDLPAGEPPATAAPADGVATTPPAGEKERMTAEAANERAKELVEERGEVFLLATAREWAEAIGCSLGLVSKLPMWQTRMEMLRKRGITPPRSKKAVRLGKLEGSITSPDEPIPDAVAELIDQQAASEKADQYKRRPSV